MKNNWKKYKKSQITEIRPVNLSDIEAVSVDRQIHSIRDTELKVSISEADSKNGSPKIGDMIARNSVNHQDQWLIAKEYFEQNYEPAPDSEPIEPKPEQPRLTAEEIFEPLGWYGYDEDGIMDATKSITVLTAIKMAKVFARQEMEAKDREWREKVVVFRDMYCQNVDFEIMSDFFNFKTY